MQPNQFEIFTLPMKKNTQNKKLIENNLQNLEVEI